MHDDEVTEMPGRCQKCNNDPCRCPPPDPYRFGSTTSTTCARCSHTFTSRTDGFVDEALTLTWTEIDARWPDAGVMWDARVSPLVDWDPLFRARGDQLWADDPRCSDLGHGRCRCLCWWREQWTTVAHHGALALLDGRLMGAARSIQTRSACT